MTSWCRPDSFEALNDREREILIEAAPLVQTRIQVLGEASGMLGFLFVADDALEMDEKAVSKLKDNAADVLDAAIETVEGLTEFTIVPSRNRCRARSRREMGVKPRLAFGPLRVAVTGRQVSPPLFESMEILVATLRWPACAPCAPPWPDRCARPRPRCLFMGRGRGIVMCARVVRRVWARCGSGPLGAWPLFRT